MLKYDLYEFYKNLLIIASLVLLQTFEEIIELASPGDVGNVCTLGKHKKTGPCGLYNNMPDEHVLFCFAQAAGKKIG